MLAAILPMMSVERGSQMVFVLQSCLLLISGVYAPLPSSIGPLRYISELSPATYVLRGVRSALIDRSGPDWGYVAILIAMAAALIPFGLWGFGQAERCAKRTGKLKRVG
jgi:ABC-2 type transport system permease protein